MTLERFATRGVAGFDTRSLSLSCVVATTSFAEGQIQLSTLHRHIWRAATIRDMKHKKKPRKSFGKLPGLGALSTRLVKLY